MRAPVSVIIPCYRCTDTIERAVSSVANQSLLPEEILLIEDFSGDGGETLSALYRQQENFSRIVPIKIIPLEKNGGPGTARNVGWENAGQPYIAFLDADDSWHPRKLEIQYSWMESHPDIALTGHKSLHLGSPAKIPQLPKETRARFFGRLPLLLSNRFPARSIMLKRELPFRFKAGKRHAEDYLLWLTIVLSGSPAARIEMPLAFSYKSDFGEAGLTGDLWKTEQGELDAYLCIYRDRLISMPAWLLLTAFSFLKYLRRRILSFLRRNLARPIL